MPKQIAHRLQKGFLEFGKKLNGFLTNEALIVAPESRTSSPVRIPRTPTLEHEEVKNLYPCAEGAGYAGGIMSAAIDGMRVIAAIKQKKEGIQPSTLSIVNNYSVQDYSFPPIIFKASSNEMSFPLKSPFNSASSTPCFMNILQCFFCGIVGDQILQTYIE